MLVLRVIAMVIAAMRRRIVAFEAGRRRWRWSRQFRALDEPVELTAVEPDAAAAGAVIDFDALTIGHRQVHVFAGGTQHGVFLGCCVKGWRQPRGCAASLPGEAPANRNGERAIALHDFGWTSSGMRMLQQGSKGHGGQASVMDAPSPWNGEGLARKSPGDLLLHRGKSP
jgi:hypothetical protein